MPRLHTKIVATLGPATDEPQDLHELLAAGVDVVRLNFSHGDEDEHLRRLESVREWEAANQRPVAVLGDLCGPKIRLNQLDDEPIVLGRGDEVQFVKGSQYGTRERLTTNHPELIDEVDVGQRILIDDGLVRFLVTDKTDDMLVCTCSTGGALHSRKGVNLPDTKLSTPALTESDREWVRWALEHEIDLLALSFVRRPSDIDELRALIPNEPPQPAIIAKIEKPDAVKHLDDIVARADGVMVARGDLGVEMDVWRVPTVQKAIVERCRQYAKPVIVATQMLQSMIDSPIPTRAEVSDVANAVFDAADAVMLSGETAVGNYPVEAVEMMARVARSAEEYLHSQPVRELDVAQDGVNDRHSVAVARAGVQAARELSPKLVAVWTATGRTVRLLARHRLAMPVVGIGHSPRTVRQMNLLYGVVPLHIPPNDHPAAMAQAIDSELLKRDLAHMDDPIIVLTSTAPQSPHATNTVLIHNVGSPR